MDKKITALKRQKRNTSRINVYLDGEFAFGVSRFVAAWLSVGQILSQEKVNQLLDADTVEKAYQRGLKSLNYRPRSRSEIQKKLEEAGYDQTVIDEVIQRLLSNGLLGDVSFARSWVENRSSFRPRSHKMLAMELRQKGVEKQVIDQVLSDAPDDNKLAYSLAEKYFHKNNHLNQQIFRTKLGNHLLRKGFNYSTVREVIEQLLSQNKLQPDTPQINMNEENKNA